MRLNISAWSIRRPVPAIVLFAVLTLLGVISFMTLPVTRFPNIDIPLVSITVVQSGAAPAELESQVTKEIEDAVANIPGVKHIMSTVTDGMSTTVMEFRLEINQDRALNDVKDAIDKIRLDLPRDINEPIVQRIDVEGQSILTFAASSPGMTLEQLSWHVDDVIKRQLQGQKGVGRVERYGGVDREIRILLDPDRLLAFGITAAEVNNQVRATNVDLGGGRGEVGGQEQAIRTLAGARRVEELGRHQDPAARRPPRAPVRSRPGDRRRQRAALVRAPQRRAGRHLLGVPLQGLERAVGRRRRQRQGWPSSASNIPTSASPRSTTPSPTRAATTPPPWRR